MAIAILVIFLSFMVAMGVWGMKKTSSLGDFFLGGRNIGPWVTAFAYGTTYFSAVLFIGFAGKLGWGFGLNSLWVVLGNTLFGTLLAWFVLGRRTRIMSQNLDVMTMPEFMYERYGGKYIKMVSAILIFVFLVPYSASVFKGLGYLFEAYFHVPYEVMLLVMVGITGVYLILGGYFAIAMTDFIQGFLMLIGAIVMVCVLTAKAGGLPQAITTIGQNYLVHVPAAKRPDVWTIASLVFMTSFGVWGMPQMVQKFYAIKNAEVIKKAAIVTTIFSLIVSFAAYWTGTLSHVFYDKLPMVNNVPAFDRLVPDLLTAYIPGALMILILLLVLSASMSTLSSLVLVSASAIAIDLYKGHIKPSIKKEDSVMMMRFLSGLFIVFSYFAARQEFYIIVTLMSLSWGAIAGAFMAPYVYGLFWKRGTLLGAKAGMVSGLATSVILFFVLGSARAPMAASIAMIVPFIVMPIVSVCTKPPEAHVIHKAFKGI